MPVLILQEALYIAICIEGFCFGNLKICVLTCTLANEVPGLGFYSGIFAIYLQCPSIKSRTTIIVLYYALCLLYVLSTVTFVSDLVSVILHVSNYSILRISFLISCAVAYWDTTTSTSNCLTTNVISPFTGPNHSKRLLWLPRPIHSSTHKPLALYLSSILLT